MRASVSRPRSPKHHPRQAEAFPHLVDLGGHGGGIGGVALEGFDGEGPPLAVEQPEDQLQGPSLAVPRVAVASQGAVAALEPGRREVIQDHALLEVLVGQSGLDGGLALEQPSMAW